MENTLASYKDIKVKNISTGYDGPVNTEKRRDARRIRQELSFILYIAHAGCSSATGF